MRQRPAMPAGTPWALRGRVYLIALAVLLVVAAGGIFAYSRVMAGAGHHAGDTITHTMPGGGSVSFTLEPDSGLTGVAAAPGTQVYDAMIRVVNATSGMLNITSYQFTAGPDVGNSEEYPAAPSCDQEIAPGDNLTCILQFALPQGIAHPVVYWLPDAAGDTSNVWWYLAA